MTRFTVRLGCGCLVFPPPSSDLEQLVDVAFEHPFVRAHAQCVIHGLQPVNDAVRNGSGFHFALAAAR